MTQQKEGNQAGRVQQGKREDKTKTIIGTKYKINKSENTETQNTDLRKSHKMKRTKIESN